MFVAPVASVHQCTGGLLPLHSRPVIDLPTLAFRALRQRLFDGSGQPRPFALRDKANTQDDPLDEFLVRQVLADLGEVICQPAPGPLIAPDMVLYRPEVSRPDDLRQIVGIEVKKIERTARGGVARASGVDFNTTPPCGRIRVFDADAAPVAIRGFYLFICLEPAVPRRDGMIVSALALADGNVLNEDFQLYLGATGTRTKSVGLGSFQDGADRERPMFIFPNPLGTPELDHSATLIHPSARLNESSPDLAQAYVLRRSMAANQRREFYCYRDVNDVQANTVGTLEDPFRTPHRDAKTRQRGRFTLPWTLDP